MMQIVYKGYVVQSWLPKDKRITEMAIEFIKHQAITTGKKDWTLRKTITN